MEGMAVETMVWFRAAMKRSSWDRRAATSARETGYQAAWGKVKGIGPEGTYTKGGEDGVKTERRPFRLVVPILRARALDGFITVMRIVIHSPILGWGWFRGRGVSHILHVAQPMIAWVSGWARGMRDSRYIMIAVMDFARYIH